MVRLLLLCRRNTQYWLGCFLLIISFASAKGAASDYSQIRDTTCDTTGKKVQCVVQDSTGYVWEIHRYKNGLKWGAWKYFNADGEMIEQKLYRKGKLIWTYFYRDGEVIQSINKKGKVKNFKGCGC